jgi:MFS transporter, DHA2 family, multidrug resistance protein
VRQAAAFPADTAHEASVPKEKASLADWLAVGAGMIGSLMALMDVSIVNASLPVIQGEIGATPSEATWVGTAYLIAEIMIIPLCAWLERLVGLRRLLVTGASLFTAFSVVCGLASNLETMIFGRIGQGLAGGVLIPTALTLVAVRLPRSQQTIGMAASAMAALLGPVIGPLLGGWLTENYSWHFAFFINVPICAGLLVLLFVAIPKSGGDRDELRNADWLGICGMALGLGALTLLLEEGHREQWFASAYIWRLAGACVLGFVLVAIGQLRAARPVLRLSLLRNRSLASSMGLLAGLGSVLFTGVFIVPQYLVSISGYNALQAGQIAFIGGLVSIPLAFIYPVTLARIDARLTIAMALSAMVMANLIASDLTPQTDGAHFVLSQIFFGFGTSMTMIPLMQSILAAVSAEDAAEANSLTTIARNLGGSIGLAATASFQQQRLDLHVGQLHASLGANDLALQNQVSESAAMLGGGPEGLDAAYRMIDGQVMLQASVMTFSDIFLALAGTTLLVMPLVLLLRPPPPGAAMAMGH